ncbi:HK97 family phage prohead protease [Nitrosomonas marina]|uniref:Prohead serine protease domain-containing protein n=1 Tax=Nitrosomonas marina TaxID=917 RepID=A0A1H8GHI3_9PROT|nr:HK97 family phage prohead protease [Nitrosomonas marina]SEN43621.1 prohead peptidase. Unknown type peptidase. MEROPS family U35 [Nitrosomonas marina]
MLQKTLSLSECKIKADSNGKGSFSGYASVFNQVDSYGDTILPGAYKDTLEVNGLPKMFLQHESWELPIGKWLKAEEDDHGLLVEGELTLGMTRANDTYAALKHGTLDGLSIGYKLAASDYKYQEDTDGLLIEKVSFLGEISPVVYPADRSARIDLGSVKSELDDIRTIRDFELFLRDAGNLSKGLAGAIVNRAKIVFGQRDADDGIEAKASQELEEVIKRINQKVSNLTIKG